MATNCRLRLRRTLYRLLKPRADMNALLRTLRAAGRAPGELLRMLDFGCAAARTLRFYPGVSAVFYDADYLVKKWSPNVRVLSVTPEAYGYQTALLIQKYQS